MTSGSDAIAEASLVDLKVVFSGLLGGRKNRHARTETRRIVIRGADGRRKMVTITVVIMTSASRSRMKRKVA